MRSRMWRTPLMAAMCLAWLCLCSSAQAGVCGGGGSCFSEHVAPGCDITSCCEAVCAIDSFCCDIEWDSICVGEAIDLCSCGGADAGDCLVANGTPGCNNADCCGEVCAVDAFCCDVEWDSICAGEAAELCEICGSPAAGDCLSENGTPACEDAACCAAVCAVDAFCCDTEWDSICVGEAVELCATCGAEAAGNCFTEHVIPACSDSACCEAVCAVDAFCCDTEWDSICVGEAVDICLGCGGVSTGSCYVTSVGPACNDSSCCETVCAIDSFCCDTAWDGICVAEAIDLCTPCGEPDSGSCFASHGNIGCADSDCCATVCSIDTFCCEVTWDGICAGEAEKFCEPCDSDCVTSGTFAPPPDGKVDAADLAFLLGDWGACAGCCGDSVSSATFAPPPDGVIDAADLAFLLGTWGNPACD